MLPPCIVSILCSSVAFMFFHTLFCSTHLHRGPSQPTQKLTNHARPPSGMNALDDSLILWLPALSHWRAYSIWICLCTVDNPPECTYSSPYFGSAIPCWDISRHQPPSFPHLGKAKLHQHVHIFGYLDNLFSQLGFRNSVLVFRLWLLIAGYILRGHPLHSTGIPKAHPDLLSRWVHSWLPLYFSTLCQAASLLLCLALIP